MNRRDIEREVFLALVNKQLEPFNVNYDIVKNNPDWYMEYRTTTEEESKFIEWGASLIRNKLKLTKAAAQQEMNWFILQWGLTTAISDKVKQKIIESAKTKKA